MIKAYMLVLVLVLANCQTDLFIVDLDLPPVERYTQLATAKQRSIVSFISHLRQTVHKYKVAFVTARLIHALAPAWFKKQVGVEFY